MRANRYMSFRWERDGERQSYITEYGKGEIQRTSVMFRLRSDADGGSAPADQDIWLRIDYRNGETFQWPCGNEYATSYLAQFGMSVSLDGRFVFIQTWDKGLFCYCARTGETVWRTKRKFGVTSIVVNEKTLLIHQHDRALQLLDIETGEVLKEKKPANDWGFYVLDDACIICRVNARTWEIIRAASLETVEVIPHKRFPGEPWCIRDVWLEDGELKVDAFKDDITLPNEEIIASVKCDYFSAFSSGE